jgi:hypothetical protein
MVKGQRSKINDQKSDFDDNDRCVKGTTVSLGRNDKLQTGSMGKKKAEKVDPAGESVTNL